MTSWKIASAEKSLQSLGFFASWFLLMLFILPFPKGSQTSKEAVSYHVLGAFRV